MLLCPNHMATSRAATVAQGESEPSCGIKGSHHLPHGAKPSQPKARFPPCPPALPFHPGWMLQVPGAFLCQLDELDTFLI